MSPEMFVDIFRDALFVVLTMVAAIILPSLGIGLVVAVFQAATSINEQTLSFLPRLIVTLLTLMFLANWLVRVLMDFTINMIKEIPMVIG
ncbi:MULTISPECIES: flagellar biosynthesis protein FliQ [Corallincola]|uniref:Flagellar biosynthetic protein FliQ n=3 Tax=Corallincola TaxID=1775176 RepID=A0A368N4T0_9GAMM|nr:MULTISPECIES: flagellar biosynthesis protein FliQ [Corallincola]RCU44561.1 flagellar biosynthetic protein FliQ [Corallincola holothuriorum]TAA40306.1 flagellar biosynthesis protein FliQ [Corallincola spongiicola]TCI05387.1 flagellar biosynthesis protein FliQ [Corallincola luteus]